MSQNLSELLTGEVLTCFLVFARVGTAMMILPMFSEAWLTARVRLVMALVVSFALVPASGVQAPRAADVMGLAGTLIGEMVVGAFLGLLMRWLFAALHVAGAAIALNSGLQIASMFDPNEASQSTIPGSILTFTMLLVMFTSDMHHLLLAGLVQSYRLMPFAGLLDLGGMTDALVHNADRSFVLAFRTAAPILLVAFLLNTALGVMNRLMPALQVMFVAAPAQIMISLIVFAAALGAVGSLVAGAARDLWTSVLGGI